MGEEEKNEIHQISGSIMYMNKAVSYLMPSEGSDINAGHHILQFLYTVV